MRTVIPSYHWFLPIISGPCELRPLMISVVCDIVSPVVLSSPYHMSGPTNQNISCKKVKGNPHSARCSYIWQWFTYIIFCFVKTLRKLRINSEIENAEEITDYANEI